MKVETALGTGSSIMMLTPDPKIFICGDFHGDVAWMQKVVNKATEMGVRLIIQVGDFPIGPFGFKDYETAFSKMLYEADIMGLVSPGNHDNWERIERIFEDGPEHNFALLAPNLILARPGARMSLNGYEFGFLGGAYSIDRGQRLEGYDWFRNEQISTSDIYRLGDDPLDVLITHDVPERTRVTEAYSLDPESQRTANQDRKMILAAIKVTKPKVLFAGHWHQRVTDMVAGTRVEVLDKEFTKGNTVLFDVRDMSVEAVEMM